MAFFWVMQPQKEAMTKFKKGGDFPESIHGIASNDRVRGLLMSEISAGGNKEDKSSDFETIERHRKESIESEIK